MSNVLVMFLSLIVTVVGLVAGDSAEAKSKAIVSHGYAFNQEQSFQCAFRGNSRQAANRDESQNLVRQKCGPDQQDCKPFCSPYDAPKFSAPAAMPAVIPAVIAATDDTSMGLAAIVGLIVTGSAGVAGVFIRKRVEDAADEQAAELAAAKEKAWREKAIKLGASKHVAND